MNSLTLVRVPGALALVVGAVHLQQFFVLYSEIPTIGTLFVLNFSGSHRHRAGAAGSGRALARPSRPQRRRCWR